VRDDADRTFAVSGASMAHDASKLRIEERRVGDVTILMLSGDMLLDDGDLAFGAQVHGLIGEGRTKVVVDFAEVAHVDSSGVGMLVAKLQKIRQKGGDLRLTRLAPRYQRLLATMKLATIFQIFEDEASAVRSFGPAVS